MDERMGRGAYHVEICRLADDAATLRTYITTYASHPNQLIYRNRVFASTFSGESCTFGQGSVADGWSSQFTSHSDLTGQNAVFFVPSFFVDPATFGTYDSVMDGALNVCLRLSSLMTLGTCADAFF